MSKTLRNIRAQMFTIMSDDVAKNDPLIIQVLTLIDDFIKGIDKSNPAFNDAFKKMPIERLNEASQVIGQRNFDFMMRLLTKAIWCEQLKTIAAKVEHLNTIQFNLLRDVTSLGYASSNMNRAGIYDHVTFFSLITMSLAEQGYAAGAAQARTPPKAGAASPSGGLQG